MTCHRFHRVNHPNRAAVGFMVMIAFTTLVQVDVINHQNHLVVPDPIVDRQHLTRWQPVAVGVRAAVPIDIPAVAVAVVSAAVVDHVRVAEADIHTVAPGAITRAVVPVLVAIIHGVALGHAVILAIDDVGGAVLGDVSMTEAHTINPVSKIQDTEASGVVEAVVQEVQVVDIGNDSIIETSGVDVADHSIIEIVAREEGSNVEVVEITIAIIVTEGTIEVEAGIEVAVTVPVLGDPTVLIVTEKEIVSLEITVFLKQRTFIMMSLVQVSLMTIVVSALKLTSMPVAIAILQAVALI